VEVAGTQTMVCTMWQRWLDDLATREENDMLHNTVNVRRNILVVSLFVLLAFGSLGLTGCISSMVIPGIAAGQWVDRLADGLAQDIITSSGLYELVVSRAQESSEIAATLGGPVIGGGIGRRSEYSFDAPGEGHADMDILVTGPEGTGKLHVVAELRPGAAGTWTRSEIMGVVVDLPEYDGSAWELTKLEFKSDEGSVRINLLGNAK
jgi:hypothetical protein